MSKYRFSWLLMVALVPLAGCTGKLEESSEQPIAASGAPATTPAEQPTAEATTEPAAEPATVPPAAGDSPFWPRFHGPRADNMSDDTGLLKAWPNGGPPLVWTAEGIGDGFAGVTLVDGYIYTAGNIDDKTTVTALDMDGNILWQEPYGEAWTENYPGSRGTPTIDGQRLYHESPTGDVVCLDSKTGEHVWTRNILSEFGSRNIRWALAESVLIDGDRVICCPGGPQTAVVALDKTNGQTVWQSPSADGDPTSYSSPVLVEVGTLRMILVMTGRALIGVNADGGELLFRHEHITKYEINALMPCYHDGHIFISSGYGSGSEMLKLDVDGDRASVSQVWQSDEMDNHHDGVILKDGYLYGSSHNRNRGSWICLNWQTGEMKWAERGVGKGSLTYADNMLYTLSENSQMGLVKVDPNAFELVSEFPLPDGGEGKSWAHPVVCGGRLYIRHGDFLYAYDVKAK